MDREVTGRVLGWTGVVLCGIAVVAFPFPSWTSAGLLALGLLVVLASVLVFPSLDELFLDEER